MIPEQSYQKDAAKKCFIPKVFPGSPMALRWTLYELETHGRL